MPKRERSSLQIFIYLMLSVVLPVLGMLLNHWIVPYFLDSWDGNILISILLVGWMGFALLTLQPYSKGKYKTVEP